MSLRIGIMGGMFDPVHSGHLTAARAAIDGLALKQLHLVPCARPNHRQAATAHADHRLQMLQLASAGDSRLLVDTREIERPGTSYAVDTVASLAAEQPAATLVFVLGLDSFATLTQWHRWQDLLMLAHLCVVARPAPVRFAVQLERLLAERRCQPEQLGDRRAGAIILLDEVSVPVSSTAVREALAVKQLPTGWLPDAVAAYISSHGLYCNT